MTIIPTPIPAIGPSVGSLRHSDRPHTERLNADERFRSANLEFVAELAKLRIYRRARLAALGQAQGRDRHAMTRRLLRDRRLHLIYAYEVTRKMKRLNPESPQNIRDLAARCNVFPPYWRRGRSHCSWTRAAGHVGSRFRTMPKDATNTVAA